METMTDARFEAYGAPHLVVLAVFVVGLVVMPTWGRSHRGTEREQPVRRAYAVVVGVVAVGMQAFQLTPGDFDVDTSLPFQLSDLSYVAAVVALWTRSPRATAFTYYVGLTLTVQALLTPSLAEGFPHPRFFGFFLLHGAVVWSAVYLVWGLGIRPTWQLFRWTVLATTAWAVAAYVFNLLADTNYGYLNAKPSSGSGLDYLGPWPVYVVATIAILVTGWAVVLTWPWTRSQRRHQRRSRSASSTPA
jgi:hypothetical integral membrane protein (TIGR02206 family)